MAALAGCGDNRALHPADSGGAVTSLVLGLALFLGVHSISIVNLHWRDRMAATLGEWPWKGLYALVSLAGLALLVHGYGVARGQPVWLYVPPAWLRHVALALLLPVFPLLLATYLPGRIRATVKHPSLVALKLWALAHLLVNGTAADVLLFGALLAWAVAERISLQRRPLRAVPQLPPSGWNDAVAVAAGLALYAAFAAWLHPLLIGVVVIR